MLSLYTFTSRNINPAPKPDTAGFLPALQRFGFCFNFIGLT